jgi:hypothetical protein
MLVTFFRPDFALATITLTLTLEFCMHPLQFFIRPLSNEMAKRTQLAHTIRGIAWQLTTPATAVKANSRLDFAFVLGLAPHVRWYAAPSRHSAKPAYAHTKTILRLAHDRWQRSLGELDLNSVELALCSLTDTQLDYAVNMIDKQLCPSFNLLNHLERLDLMKPSETIPLDVMDKLTMALASLEASLLAKDPMMPQHLRATHSLLITYPETVHLLDDEEIARIIDGAEILTKTEIVKAVASKAATGTRKKVSASDL